MDAVKWLGFGLGIVLFGATFVNVLNTLLLPRAARSELGVLTGRLIRGLLTWIAVRLGSYERKDRLLGYVGPLWIVVMLVIWLVLVWIAFGLLMWPFIFAEASFFDALRFSGSGMFTLGFATPVGAAPLLLTLGAAASGLGVVSVMIAFLPALYSSFNRRETLVTMLDALGGSPAWGPEILARQELIDNVGALDGLYQRWAEWAAEVSESHTTYRVLNYLRSPSPLRSWVIGLLAVLDAAALHLALNPLSAPPSARWLMRMGIVSLREIAASLRLPFHPDPTPDDPVQLTREDFDEGVAVLDRVGWKTERDLDTAWIHFRGWRVNYEETAYGIAAHIKAPRAPWSGPRQYGGVVIPPARPPHREPTPQLQTLRDTTLRRREVRAHNAHVHDGHVDAAAGDVSDISPAEAHEDASG